MLLVVRRGLAVGLSDAGLLLRRPKSTFKRRFPSDPPVSSSGVGLHGVLLLAVPVTTFCLGVWQTSRRSWKLDLVAKLSQRSNEDPQPLANDIDLSEMEYRRVTVRGTFDHDKEVYIGPRTCISDKDNQKGGLFASGESVGWNVVTPLRVAGQNRTILVNRGWVPKDKIRPETRREGQVEGEVDIVGVVRTSEKREPFMPKNQVDAKKWQMRDVDAISEVLGTEALLIDADAASTVRGGPIGGQTRLNLRNEHFSYMMTWFGLSAATSYMWLKRFVLHK